ncbi:tyrosine-type recombinase/integrase [Phyllobacterium sp. CL33Tsu]|uniref:tyrosine-type recombinase/integrase n=1 Tax=Phyllobacterium sp. CL33Tsu TaxID=1798191 RepID=UPI001587723D|nr:tyrosine-type recombinase/integrase [Phyllobacterium sp. CL33Tsu]
MFYFRLFKGPRIRLPGDPDSIEFKEAYKLALSGRPSIAPSKPETHTQSIRWLIERYKESRAWGKLTESTRGDRDGIFTKVIEQSKNVQFQFIDRAAINQAMDDRQETPFAANNFLKAMRGLFEWAKDNNHVKEDPTIGIKFNRADTEGFKPWTIEDYAKFIGHYPIGTKPRLAIELLIHSGLRRSDIVLAGRQHLRGNVFAMQTKKTKAWITVEFPQSLLAIIHATETGDFHFLSWGKARNPYKAKGFQSWFRKQCDEAGIDKELSAHGVRKLAATLSADGGAQAWELMAQFGWTNVKQAEIYTKGADRKALGIRSSRRIVDQIENAIPRTDNQVRELDEKAK